MEINGPMNESVLQCRSWAAVLQRDHPQQPEDTRSVLFVDKYICVCVAMECYGQIDIDVDMDM